MIFRLGGRHFSGATQLLQANVCTKTEAVQAATALSEVVAGELPLNAEYKVDIPKEAWKFKEFRQPTKYLLCGLANSLQQAMPLGWSLACCRPPNPLMPATSGCARLLYDASETALMVPPPPEHARLHFVWDPESKEARADHYLNENFTRLVFSADEGTEACRDLFVSMSSFSLGFRLRV